MLGPAGGRDELDGPTSLDLQFDTKQADVCGLYLNPLEPSNDDLALGALAG